MKCISSIKLEKVFFATGLGKEHFIEMILEALLRSVVCKNENLGTFQFIGLWFYKCTPRSTL